MRIVETVAALRAEVDAARRAGSLVGLVPTMGYLHNGHVSLLRRARAECGLVVLSIFVNPLQFGPTEDLDRYPRDFDGDCAKAEAAGCDVVFAPSVAEMYPEGEPLTRVRVERVSEGLCGVSRPVHFEGVATVVAKLFAASEADRAYFGRKDGQQVAVVARMAADLNFRTVVVPCPTLREADGLAMSSRNAYLTPEDRAAAPALYRALTAAAGLVVSGERDSKLVESKLNDVLALEPRLDVEYGECRDARTMQRLDRLDGDVIVAVAAKLGSARLIDNVVLHVDGDSVEVEAGETTTAP